jgi:lysozyme family protein
MLILRGIAGHFAGRDWPRGALDEPSALAYAQRTGYIGKVLDVPGATGVDSPQVRMALVELRNDPSIAALYGFSGGGYNVRHILSALTPDERKRIRKVVVLGAPNNPPSLYRGQWQLVYRTDPPGGHMDGPRALLAETPELAMPTFDSLRAEYVADWKRMAIKNSKREAVDAIARRLIKNKARYQNVADKTGIPWFFIAVIHQREADADFTTHLHNGDPLSARTYHVPAGRPRTGRPPFTWEESALDALIMRGLDKIKDWPIERCAYEAEGYNGWGYRSHGVPSAYLWSFSNIYRDGKYVADGEWDSGAIDAQCGVMPMLFAMSMLDNSMRFDGGPKPLIVPEPTPPPPPAPPDIEPVSPKPSPPRPLWRVFLDLLLGRRT